ncbi:MAG: hypothetical protein ABI831_23495 [Betaproteobacteria bacterium]
MQVISDPRIFPQSELAPTAQHAGWYRWVEDSLVGATGRESAAADAALRRDFLESLLAGNVAVLGQALSGAPSAAVYRHLLRLLSLSWRHLAAGTPGQLTAHGFAIPVVIVCSAASAQESPATLESAAISALLRAHGALGGNETFGVANVLAGAGAVGIHSLPHWLGWRNTLDRATALREVEPAVLRIAGGQESAHVAYLIGTALAAPEARLFDESGTGAWGMPLAQMLSRHLAVPGAQVLALPRGVADPVAAEQIGLVAQREIALQLFASNAIRESRATFGEPTAVLSVHRLGRGGELRLSISSPFGEREAAGFRCPLFPFERVEEVLEIVVALLRACRVADIRVMSGIHGDRDLRTGLTLLFRADAVGPGESVAYH